MNFFINNDWCKECSYNFKLWCIVLRNAYIDTFSMTSIIVCSRFMFLTRFNNYMKVYVKHSAWSCRGLFLHTWTSLYSPFINICDFQNGTPTKTYSQPANDRFSGTKIKPTFIIIKYYLKMIVYSLWAADVVELRNKSSKLTRKR